MKVYEDFEILSDASLNASLIIRSPESGFRLSFGTRDEEDLFITGFTFYGYSGMLFDGDNNFFGGYTSGKAFNIHCHLFDSESRISYFFNDVLMNNNMSFAPYPVSTVEFDKINGSTVSLWVNENTGSFFLDYLQSNDGFTLFSQDNRVLRVEL